MLIALLLYFIFCLVKFILVVSSKIENVAIEEVLGRTNVINLCVFSLEETFKDIISSVDYLNSDALDTIARISDSSTLCTFSIVDNHSAFAEMHLGRDDQPIDDIRRLALFTKLQLQDLDTIKLSFASLYNPIYQEKNLVYRVRAQVSSLRTLRWYKLEKVLDEETRSLDILVELLNRALSPISEVHLCLQVVRDLLVDVERHYQEVKLTGHEFCLEHLKRSLSDVEASLTEIAIVINSVHQ